MLARAVRALLGVGLLCMALVLPSELILDAVLPSGAGPAVGDFLAFGMLFLAALCYLLSCICGLRGLLGTVARETGKKAVSSEVDSPPGRTTTASLCTSYW